jgi:hypothetical protein
VNDAKCSLNDDKCSLNVAQRSLNDDKYSLNDAKCSLNGVRRRRRRWRVCPSSERMWRSPSKLQRQRVKRGGSAQRSSAA